MVLPVTQAAMSPANLSRKVGRWQLYSNASATSDNHKGSCTISAPQKTSMYHQSRFSSNETLHSFRNNAGRVLNKRSQPAHQEEGKDHFRDRSSKGFFALLLVPLLLAGHFQRASALSCDICDRSKCANTTDCPGGVVLDVCHCCMVCARGINQTCGGIFGILGKCDRNLHCFIQHPDSPKQDGICKELHELDCNGTDCPPAYQPESLCPRDSYIAVSNSAAADGDTHESERLQLLPPLSPLVLSSSSSSSSSSSLSASPAHAGSGHGKDDFSSTNTFTNGAEEDDYNNRERNSFDDFGSASTHRDEDEDDFIRTNTNEFHGNDIQRDSEFHEGISEDEYIDYHEENTYTLAEMPTSFCVCNFSTCQIPECAEGFAPALVRNGTGIPGSCCDIYECKAVEACKSLICPVIEEASCPPDSLRPPPRLSQDFCCKVQQECTCRPMEECETVQCPDGFQLQVVSIASRQPGSCCDKFRCVNESGLTCSYNGKELMNGESWEIDKCKTCMCRDGLNRCKDKSCESVSCTWMVIPDGECCPVCRGCVSDSGELYNDADVWRENDCTTCICKDGHAQCQAERCAVSCSNPINVPGQCCPVCPDENVAMSRLCPDLDKCDLSCPLGLDHGEDGCVQCRCKEKTCDLDCPYGLQSDVEGRLLCKCIDGPGVFEPTGCPLKDADCAKKCEYGFQRGLDGCTKCKCNRCPQAACTKTCLHGYVSNDDGCELCKCKDAPSPSLTYPPMSADGKSCMSRAGAHHDDGESWNDGCRVCYCHHGIEMCSLIACPAPHCSNPVFRTGDCCPTCPGLTVVSPQGDQELCQSSQGRYYVEGEIWKLDDCTQCVCHGGAILCQTPACPPVLCHHPIRSEGSCCASCKGDPVPALPAMFPRHCKSSTGIFYKHGEIWQPTPCQSCACENGQIQCFNQMCPPVNCNRTILKKGQCCPVCVESRRLEVCVYNGAHYEEGEQWQGDNCTQCICVNGKYQCFPLACPNLHCRIMVVRKGHCCPECYDISMLQEQKDRKDNDEKSSNQTGLPVVLQKDKAVGSGSKVDANVIGFSILGILVFLLAIAVLLLVFFILRRRHKKAISNRFRPRPKSTNLELQGHMPFIPQDNMSGDSGNGSGVDGSDPQLHPKTVEAEKQLLEKLCSGLVNERETRASNPYTEMVFGDQVKESSRGSGHFLASVKT